jgi:hypothetical protein
MTILGIPIPQYSPNETTYSARQSDLTGNWEFIATTYEDDIPQFSIRLFHTTPGEGFARLVALTEQVESSRHGKQLILPHMGDWETIWHK